MPDLEQLAEQSRAAARAFCDAWYAAHEAVRPADDGARQAMAGLLEAFLRVLHAETAVREALAGRAGPAADLAAMLRRRLDDLAAELRRQSARAALFHARVVAPAAAAAALARPN
jgi:hypothetical protein